MAIQTRSIDRILSQAFESGANTAQPLHQLLGMEPREFSDRRSRDEDFASKIREVESVIQFISSSAATANERRDRVQQEISAAADAERAARRGHIEAIRAHEEKKQTLQLVEEEAGLISKDEFATMVRDFSYIAANPAARNVTMTAGSNPRLIVEPYPLVIEHNGSKYLFENLKFSVHFRTMAIKFEDSVSMKHPHVSTGNTICWGEAEVPVTQSRERRDFVGLTRLVTDYLTMYNSNSPYVEISSFPAAPTNASPGWQIEN